MLFKRISLSINQIDIVVNALEAYYYDILDCDYHPAKSDLEAVKIVLDRFRLKIRQAQKPIG